MLKCKKAWVLLILIALCLSGCVGKDVKDPDTASDPLSAESSVVDVPAQVSVPILMYHHLADESNGASCMSTALFEQHMDALCAAGYHTVSFADLINFVEHGTDLPEKPIVITFDDGYLSNYEIAYPILQARDMKATIFIIGVSVGKTTYKDTSYPITPHFTYEQAKEMVDSGLIEIQSHTYDMHQWQPFEEGPARVNATQMPWESEEEYVRYFRDDIARSVKLIEENVGCDVYALAYPGGARLGTFRAALQRSGNQSDIIGLRRDEYRGRGRFGLPLLHGTQRYHRTDFCCRFGADVKRCGIMISNGCVRQREQRTDSAYFFI